MAGHTFMNVTELARQLRINTKDMLEILPQYGFDIGQKAIKVDNKVATQILKRWRYIKKDQEDKKRKEQEEKKKLEKEMRLQSGEKILLPNLITVKDFAGRLNMSVVQVITELMKNGILANQNQNIDYETAAIIAAELGFVAEKEIEDQGTIQREQEKEDALEKALAKHSDAEQRPPVIVVMGHVDHGKTKLLDAIRQTNVIDTEAGGITQHIGAYQTIWRDPKTQKERAITFIDTPGHEAFTVMRSRGAKVADIAILIVAADDGVKPQTEEVIRIIRAARLPFVVAINKVDKEGADPQRVRTELSQRGVLCEEWGGDVPMVEISAKQKQNIDKLLDVLLLVAEMHQDKIRAQADGPAVGTVIESHVDKGMGPVATILVQAGTLHRGDPLVVNNEIYGKVRAMRNYNSQEIDAAGPSNPAQIIGFKVAPEVGDIMNLGVAASATKIDVKEKKMQQTGAEKTSLFSADNRQETGQTKSIDLLIKADVLGSLEAIIGSLEKLHNEEVGVRIVGKGLGNVTEDDVHKAEAGNAIVIGFHVNATPSAELLMRDKSITFLKYLVIYDLINWVRSELEKMLDKEQVITELGRVKVLAIFRTDKRAMTIGGQVLDGSIKPNSLVRIKRQGDQVGEGKLLQCKVGQVDMKEVAKGTECGLRFEGKDKIEVGDILEVYTEEIKVKKLIIP